jgi:glycosyltransferase involved in cell wall biosynthesis
MTGLNQKPPADKKFRICFVSLNAYPYLIGQYKKFAGGAERQQVLLAKELARRGHQISFIVSDHGQADIMMIGNILVYKHSLPQVLDILTSIKLRWFCLWINFLKTLAKPNADIYYQRTASYTTGTIAFFCFLKRKKFIYSIAHNFDVNGTAIHDSYIIDVSDSIRRFLKKFYIMGLRLADCVIAQNNEQQILLQKNYGKKSVLIKSLYDKQENDKQENIQENPVISEILWVSSIQIWKKPEVFLELAKKIPCVQFRMIGGPSVDKHYYKNIEVMADRIPNLEFTGFIPPDQIQKFYQKAIAFVNTSDFEGFPNTFLEAWSNAVPVISLNVDPEEIICKNNLGFHSKTFDQLVLDVKRLLKDPELRAALGKNGRIYVEKEHSLESIALQYENVFKNLMT